MPRVRAAMHSWEIVCVETDDDSDFEDCRAITQLGYLAPTLRKKSTDVVGAQIHQDHRAFHVVVDGERVPLEAARDEAVNFYVRTREEDDPEDPLLRVPQCSTYELEEHLEDVR